MVLDAFQQRKDGVLAVLQADCGDKSRKGSVDAPVAALVARINAHPALYTTSSCSGRITVFGEPTAAGRAAGKKGGEWVFASHEEVETEAVLAAIHRGSQSGNQLVLRFEPFILALEANTPAMGQRVLTAARAAGFRESGLTLGSGGKRVMVGVRCSLRLEVPVADDGAVLVPDSYLRYVVQLANAKFRTNLARIARFEQELFVVLEPPPPPPPPEEAATAAAESDSRTVLSPSLDPTAAGALGAARRRRRGDDSQGRPALASSSSSPSTAGAVGTPMQLMGRARTRRGGPVSATSSSSAPGPGSSPSRLKALRNRQERLLTWIQQLEQRVPGGPSEAAEAPALAAAAAATRPAAPAPPAAAAAAAAPPAVVAHGVLTWRPVPVSALQVVAQASIDEDVPRWGHASAVIGPRIYLLGGYGGSGTHRRRSDVLVYDTQSRTWDSLCAGSGGGGAAATAATAGTLTPTPPPRMDHTAVAVGGGYIVMIGGRTSPQDALSDVWILDPEPPAAGDSGDNKSDGSYGVVKSRIQWIQVHPRVDETTTAGSRCPHTAFPGRYRHSAVAVPPPPHGPAAFTGSDRARHLDGWRVVVYGGRNADAVLGDTWVLCREAPSSAAAVVAGTADGSPTAPPPLLVQGWVWRQVVSPTGTGAAASVAPGPRKSHAAAFVPAALYAGRMYVHGGKCGYGMHFADTQYLDLDSYSWHAATPTTRTPVTPAAAPASSPRSRPSPPPACFSHTLSRWGPYLLLVGGYPTDHHRQLHVMDTRDHRWHALDTAVAAAPTAPAPPPAPPEAAADFVPIRHCAEVVAVAGTREGEDRGAAPSGGSLYVLGGGALCFSFGSVFGGCFELALGGGALEGALGLRGAVDGSSAPCDTADACARGDQGSNSSAEGASSLAAGWAVRLPAGPVAKELKDELKTAGWLDGSRRVGSSTTTAATPATSSTSSTSTSSFKVLPDGQHQQQQVLFLPVTDQAAEVLRRAGAQDRLGAGAEGGKVEGAAGRVMALMQAAGAQLLTAPLAPSSKRPVSPAQRLQAAVTDLLRTFPGLRAAAAATTAAAAAGAGAAAEALVSELLSDLPTRWERLGDLALLPASALSHPGWAAVLGSGGAAGAGAGGEDAGGEDAGGEVQAGPADPVLLPLWRAVADALGVKRLARQAPVANTGTRDSRAVLLLGSDGWVAHREGGVLFRLDVTRCMFSSGNVTERTRIGWGRGGLADGYTSSPSASSSSSSAAAAAAAAPSKPTSATARAGAAAVSREGVAAAPAAAAGPAADSSGGGGSGSDGGGRARWAVGETVVDLYCGIGYYTVPLLVVAGVDKVYACEWNPYALEALRLNLQQPALGCPAGSPAVADRCEVRPGDCREVAPRGVADRVMLGLLPSSKGGWATAIRALKPDEGGWLHLHHNVTDSEEPQWLYDTMDELRRLAAAEGRAWQLALRHVERVKWYAPHVRHIVMDIECRPAGILTHPSPQPVLLASTRIDNQPQPQPQPPSQSPARHPQPRPETHPQLQPHPHPQPYLQSQPQPHAHFRSHPAGTAAGGSGPRWYDQPLELLPRVRRVPGPASRAEFEAGVSAGREPVVLEGLDLGPAPHTWTPRYLASLPAAKTTLVSVHVSRDPSGCLDFAGRKNFAFRTMPLAELVERIAEGLEAVEAEVRKAQDREEAGTRAAGTEGGRSRTASACPELVPRGEEYGTGREVLYLRSIGENPRREPACLSASFPSLAPDLRLPPLFPPEALHSSVLRVSSPGLVLWTHYDVMDNLLVQVRGTKRVLLWPPSCHDALHVSGSSSPITRLDAPDLDKFPRYASCPPPLVAPLAPGDVLFLPSLWLHNVTATGDEMSVSVNAFWRHLPPEFYHRKDLYGNRDLVQAEAADAAASEALAQLSALPPHYRDFYGARLLGRMQRELGLGA